VLFRSEKLKNSYTKIFNYPIEKNYSDFELASDYIINNEEKSDVLLFNMFGKRVDQLLFNLEVCKKLTKEGFRVIMLGSSCEIYFLKDNSILEINGKMGDIISILPAESTVDVKKTEGLKYELINEKLYSETTRGLSNELIKDSCKIEINEGIAIIVYLKE
jgi:thiamine pyrophosphokinase